MKSYRPILASDKHPTASGMTLSRWESGGGDVRLGGILRCDEPKTATFQKVVVDEYSFEDENSGRLPRRSAVDIKAQAPSDFQRLSPAWEGSVSQRRTSPSWPYHDRSNFA